MHSVAETTQLVRAWRSGDPASLELLLPMVYDTLRGMAASRFGQRPDANTLQPTALVHEALLRMLGSGAQWEDRAHFLAVASLKMRAVLVDHARARAAAKRGDGISALTLSHAERESAETTELDVLALHAALEQLAHRDQRTAQAVEMTYFGGMERAEIATALGISVATVDRELRFGKAWLNQTLTQ